MATIGTEVMSAREAEVLAALGDHLTNAQIAQRLHISVRTVESHVSSLLRKLGAGDRRDLAARSSAITALAEAEPVAFAGLPHRWTTFIGRQLLIDEIVEAVGVSRMITLLGPGGIGKTSLATVVAERVAPTLTGGGVFVDLVPVRADFVVQAVAAALGVTERPNEPLEQVVHERLRQGRTLVLLDNCEHVLETAASFARGVVSACPDAIVLATSRERLGVPGELVVLVGPLAVAAADDRDGGTEAELLFIDRAARGALLDSDRALVTEICCRLDGMPLAIELAAARSASLGVDGLLAGLDDHLRLLTSGPTGRHQSLRGVIDWSHDLLDDEERVLFRRLGVFAGAFDLDAVLAVATDGDRASASDVVGRLADKSLLVHSRDGAGSRWRMLETVHAYALEQLAASGELDDISRCHLTWAASRADELEALLDTDRWRSPFDAIADDLRAALTAVGPGSEALGHRLATALVHLSYARRFLAESTRHGGTAVELAPDVSAKVAALRLSADVAFAQMRGDVAFEHLMAAFELSSTSGDDAVAALVLADAATVAGRAPATFESPPTHEELGAMVARARALAPDDLEVETHVMMAAAWNGRPGPTEPDPALAQRALELARELGDAVLISGALDAVGAAAAAAGSYREAWRFSVERLDLLDRLPRHDPYVGGEVADIFHMGTESAMGAGQLGAALAAATLSRGDGHGQGQPHFAAAHLVVPLALRGEFDEALSQAAIMLEGWERTGRAAAGWMAPSFFAVALVHGVQGDAEDCDRWWELAEMICRQTRTNSFGAFAGPRIALHLGDLERAEAAALRPRGATAGQYELYAAAMSVEVAVAIGADDAERRLSEASAFAAENDFAAACLQRAAGRLHGDEDELLAAVSQWEQIGARFERASTLLLVPARRAEGVAELEELGSYRPIDSGRPG